MRTLCVVFVVVALLVALYPAMDHATADQVEDVADDQAWVDQDDILWDVDPNQQCGDAHVNSLMLGGQALRTRVNSCAQVAAFGMAPTARELFLRNIPVRFDQFNAKPRGCVEIDMRVDEERSGRVHRRWQVIVDVDNKTATQNAHYGYTVEGLIPRVPKRTGHVFFPANVFPPNVRPWLNEPKGQIVYFADRKNGPTANTVFKLSGKMFNQFHTRKARIDDDDMDEDVDGIDVGHDDDKDIALPTDDI